MLIPKLVEPQIVLTKKLSPEGALFSSARLKATSAGWGHLDLKNGRPGRGMSGMPFVQSELKSKIEISFMLTVASHKPYRKLKEFRMSKTRMNIVLSDCRFDHTIS